MAHLPSIERGRAQMDFARQHLGTIGAFKDNPDLLHILALAFDDEAIKARNGQPIDRLALLLITGYPLPSLFKELYNFKLTVPKNFSAGTAFEDYLKRHPGSNPKVFTRMDLPAPTDAMYPVTEPCPLIPGRCFEVKVVQPLLQVLDPSIALAYLKEIGAVLTGARGAALACEQFKSNEKLNKRSRAWSLDEPAVLWKNSKNQPQILGFQCNQTLKPEKIDKPLLEMCIRDGVGRYQLLYWPFGTSWQRNADEIYQGQSDYLLAFMSVK